MLSGGSPHSRSGSPFLRSGSPMLSRHAGEFGLPGPTSGYLWRVSVRRWLCPRRGGSPHSRGGSPFSCGSSPMLTGGSPFSCGGSPMLSRSPTCSAGGRYPQPARTGYLVQLRATSRAPTPGRLERQSVAGGERRRSSPGGLQKRPAGALDDATCHVSAVRPEEGLAKPPGRARLDNAVIDRAG